MTEAISLISVELTFVFMKSMYVHVLNYKCQLLWHNIVNDHESTFRDTLEIEVDMCFSDQINVFVILVTVLKEDGRKKLMPDYLDGEICQFFERLKFKNRQES